MKLPKFTIKQFNDTYPDDNACLEKIFELRYGNPDKCVCPKCKKETKFHKYSQRKAYSCQNCGHDISPLADTIFHKSSTSLKNWFYAMYLFSTSKNGVSAKELERQLGVTYKCAWRIAKQIRLLFKENNIPFFGIAEADETYVGGKGKNKKRGRGAENKTPVFGMIERKGRVKAKVVSNAKAKTLMPIIHENLKEGSDLMTDEWPSYNTAKQLYNHQVIKHGVKEYARGNVHTNNIEGFWSQLKRSFHGTYHVISPKYLQSYVDEFSFRYNHRDSLVVLFDLMVSQVLKPVSK